jgi:hypothetical protein
MGGRYGGRDERMREEGGRGGEEREEEEGEWGRQKRRW